jgi:two-component system alkaline phosphatase synthesis response regulator PhoP
VLVIITGNDPESRDLFEFSLRQAGLEVKQLNSLDRCLERWPQQTADLVLAIQPENQDLVAAIRAFRRLSDVPLVVLYEGAASALQLASIRAGADLLWDGPMDPRLCAAYCLNFLRRASGAPAGYLPKLKLAGLELNPSTRSVSVQEEPPLRLTYLEFKLLHLLMTYNGQVIPTEDLIERVWGYDEYGSGDLVRGLVSRLRTKLGDDPNRPRYIETVSGVGYRFRLDD